MKKHNYIKYILIVLISSLMYVQCTKTYTAEQTNSSNVAGEYWVRIDSISGTAGADFSKFTQYYSLTTFNTADNNSDLWISMPTPYNFKSKIKSDNANYTFGTQSDTISINNINDTSYKPLLQGTITLAGLVVLVKNTKIIKNGWTSLISKATSDSIYFELTFPKSKYLTTNKVYKVGGYRRTRFLEDDK